MKKIFIILLCLIGSIGISKAQNLSLNYQMSVPTGSVKNFIDDASFRGFGINYHYFVDKGQHLSLGLEVSWDTYYDAYKNISGNFKFQNDNNIYTITGNQYRYVNFVPMLAQARYSFFNEMALFRPYVGMGVGTSWCEKRTEIGELRSEISRWQFAMSPEIGVVINATSSIGINVGARYMYATQAANGRIPEIQQFTFSIGLVVFGVE